MPQMMTIGEIREQYVSQWVYVEDEEKNEYREVVRGRVVCHDKDEFSFFLQLKKLSFKPGEILHTDDPLLYEDVEPL